MKYRKYNGYTIVKDFVLNSYSIEKDGAYLYHDLAKVSCSTLNEAKRLIDMDIKGDLKNTKYKFWK